MVDKAMVIREIFEFHSNSHGLNAKCFYELLHVQVFKLSFRESSQFANPRAIYSITVLNCCVI